MAPTDQKLEGVLPAEVLAEMPLPSDRKVTFLGGLFVLALLAAAYIASEIVLPLVFAITLKLLLQPALRVLARLHVPRSIAALLLILTLFGTIVGLVLCPTEVVRRLSYSRSLTGAAITGDCRGRIDRRPQHDIMGGDGRAELVGAAKANSRSVPHRPNPYQSIGGRVGRKWSDRGRGAGASQVRCGAGVVFNQDNFVAVGEADTRHRHAVAQGIGCRAVDAGEAVGPPRLSN